MTKRWKYESEYAIKLSWKKNCNHSLTYLLKIDNFEVNIC